jgi:hypothetical protein
MTNRDKSCRACGSLVEAYPEVCPHCRARWPAGRDRVDLLQKLALIAIALTVVLLEILAYTSQQS